MPDFLSLLMGRPQRRAVETVDLVESRDRPLMMVNGIQRVMDSALSLIFYYIIGMRLFAVPARS